MNTAHKARLLYFVEERCRCHSGLQQHNGGADPADQCPWASSHVPCHSQKEAVLLVFPLLLWPLMLLPLLLCPSLFPPPPPPPFSLYTFSGPPLCESLMEGPRFISLFISSFTLKSGHRRVSTDFKCSFVMGLLRRASPPFQSQ